MEGKLQQMWIMLEYSSHSGKEKTVEKICCNFELCLAKVKICLPIFLLPASIIIILEFIIAFVCLLICVGSYV